MNWRHDPARATPDASSTWRQSFIRTFLERDMPQLGVRVPAATLLRLWSMLAHYHGQVWNGTEFARAFGVSGKTVRHYLDTLRAEQVARVPQPWHENIRKRQVKSLSRFATLLPDNGGNGHR